MVLLVSSFSLDVRLLGKNFDRFKVQIPPKVEYSVVCDSCEYVESSSYGVRYVEITVYKDGKVEVIFPDVKGKEPKNLSFRTLIMLESVLNPHPEWVVSDIKPTPLSLPQNPFKSSEVWIKIKITRSGIYEIPFSDIRSFGININDYPLSTIKMVALLDTLRSPTDSAFNMKYKVPVWVDVEGGRILFWGESQRGFRILEDSVEYFENPYTDTTYYFLGLGGGGGERVKVKTFPGGPQIPVVKYFRFEENINNAGKKGRVWLGREMTRNSSEPEKVYKYVFKLKGVVSAVKFKTGIANSEFSDSTASVVVKINGNVCDSVSLLPKTYTVASCVPSLADSNTVEYVIKPSGGAQTLYLDYYEVSYISDGSYGNEDMFFISDSGNFTLKLKGIRPVFVWDVSNPYDPKIVESYTYSSGNLYINYYSNGRGKIYLSNFARKPISMEVISVSNDLYSTTFDYVAIGNKRFSGTSWKLLNFRKDHLPVFNGGRWEYSSGSVGWVNLEDVFLQFSLGNPDPVAIRNFLYNMYLRSGSSRPLYAVIVGDGSYDYKGYTENYFPHQVPPYYPISLSLSVNLDNFGAYDDFFGDFDGNFYSDIGIGRIPVRDEKELNEYITKVIEYESNFHDGPWRYNVLLVADDERNDSPTSCEIFHTYDLLYVVRPQISPRINSIPFLMQKYPLEGYTKPKATADLVEILNRGVLMASFFIHGNPVQMAHERLFTIDDVGKLNTRGKEAFITVLSCKVGAYDRIDPIHVLGEEMMLRRNRGIAVLSSTALAYAGSNTLYARAIYSYLTTYGKTPLGYLSLVGKNDIYYVLLGDPAIMLKLPDSVSPVISDTLTRGSKNFVISPDKGKLLVLDIPDIDTVSFTCITTKYSYYTQRPRIYFGNVARDSVWFWVPFAGNLSTSDSSWQKASILLWKGDIGYAALYPVLFADSSIGDYKPKVYGFYRGEKLHDGFTLPAKSTLEFIFISREGFDIRTSGKGSSPPRIIIDNSFTDILDVEIINDTTARTYYDFDFSTSPGVHRIGVSVSSAKGVRGYSVWNLKFVEDSLRIYDLVPYPNPYRGGKMYITFRLSKTARVKTRVYTVTGKVIRTFNNGSLQPGFNSIGIDLSDLSNGIFVVLVEATAGDERVKEFTRILVLK